MDVMGLDSPMTRRHLGAEVPNPLEKFAKWGSFGLAWDLPMRVVRKVPR